MLVFASSAQRDLRAGRGRARRRNRLGRSRLRRTGRRLHDRCRDLGERALCRVSDARDQLLRKRRRVRTATPNHSGTCREGGIFRYDRDTGELALVADGTEVGLNAEGECEPSKLIFSGAESPSVSADGRYVAFSTAQQLVPQDTNENVDVYVRDMDVPLTADRKGSGAYTLVSAKSGGEEPADLRPRNPPLPGAEPGAEVWPNTAISADGRYVVFRTTEQQSNLPDGSTADTPPRTAVRAGPAGQDDNARDLREKGRTRRRQTGRRRRSGPRASAPTVRLSPGLRPTRPRRPASCRASRSTRASPTTCGDAGRNRAPSPAASPGSPIPKIRHVRSKGK